MKKDDRNYEEVPIEKEISNAIQNLVGITQPSFHLVGVKWQKLARKLCDSILSCRFMGGLVEQEAMRRCQQYYRKEVFPPWKVLRSMDLAGGGLCYEGVNILRQCKTGGRKYYRGSILPCTADLKQAAKTVKSFAKIKLSFEKGTTEDTGAEFIEFNPCDVVKMAFRAFKLDKVAETRRVSIATSIDAAQLSKRHIHTTMGIKINDKEAICPFTDRPIFGYNKNASSQESMLVHSLVQSRNCCFPVKIVLAKETKSIYKHFESVFKTFTTKNEALESSALLGASYKPLKTSIECDMSAQWKGLGRGGGMNNQLQYPCQCCAINDAHVVTPNAVHCNTWCKQYREDYPDEHHN